MQTAIVWIDFNFLLGIKETRLVNSCCFGLCGYLLLKGKLVFYWIFLFLEMTEDPFNCAFLENAGFLPMRGIYRYFMPLDWHLPQKSPKSLQILKIGPWKCPWKFLKDQNAVKFREVILKSPLKCLLSDFFFPFLYIFSHKAFFPSFLNSLSFKNCPS